MKGVGFLDAWNVIAPITSSVWNATLRQSLWEGFVSARKKVLCFLGMNVYRARLSGVSNVRYPILIAVRYARKKHKWARVDSVNVKILLTSPPMKERV